MAYRPEVLLNSVLSAEVPSPSGQVLRLSPSGSKTAVVDAVTAAYPLAADTAGRIVCGADQLDRLTGQKVTLLARRTDRIYGTPQLGVWQGTIVRHEGRICLLPKGHSRRGFDVTGWEILDTVLGQTAASLATIRERVEQATALFPTVLHDLAPDSFASLPVMTDPGQEDPCTLAALTTRRGLKGERIGGALWLFSNRRPDTSAPDASGDTLNGVLIVPPSTLTSEHGSIRTDRLRGGTTAVITIPVPVPFRLAVDLASRTAAHSYLKALQALAPSTT
jgi:hypothetical protein